MPRSNQGRTFSSEEFALVLRRAGELQDARRNAPRARDGLTLAEMQQIAREVGLDPALVAEAAALVQETHSDRPGFFELQSEFFAAGTVQGSVPAEQLGEVVHLIRRELGKPGQVQQVLDAVEWSHSESLGAIHVTVRPHEGRTRVEVMADRETEEAVIVGIPTIAGILTGLITAGSMGVDAQSIALGIVVAGGAHGLARAAWVWVSRTWQNRISELANGLAEGIASLREESAGATQRAAHAARIPTGSDAPAGGRADAEPADAELRRKMWSEGQ